MNQPHNSPPSDGPTMAADDVLPSVQPPAASFIVQLFLIPMLIVSIIVAVWMMFSWLARTNDNPQELVVDIERLNHSSWQKALTLAQLLRDPRHAELRQDAGLANRLSGLLEKQIQEGRSDGDHHRLRLYLCRALGHFEVADGCTALAAAATTEKQSEDIQTRLAGLQALAELAGNIDPAEIAENKNALAAILKGTEEYSDNDQERRQREALRSTATYTLGLMPKEVAAARLAELLHDPSLDVNYNAAIGLARMGDLRCLKVLNEMLNPPDEALIESDPVLTDVEKQGQKDWKRVHVVTNALRAITKLYGEYPEVDLSELKLTIKKLSEDSGQPNVLRIRADEVLHVLNQ